MLFLYTDGVTEAEDLAAEEFGEQRLQGLLAANEERNAAQWIGVVDAAVRTFSEGRPSVR